MPSMPRDNCCFLACDKSKDFFCESNDDTSGKSKKTVCSLGRVVGLQRKSDLHDTEAEQDKSDCTDKSENEIGQIVYYRDRVVCRKCGYTCAEYNGHRQYCYCLLYTSELPTT